MYCRSNLINIIVYCTQKKKVYIPLTRTKRISVSYFSSRNFSEKFIPNLCPDIEFEELKEKLENKKIILIDVRTPEEQKVNGYIPGSVNLPLTPLGEALLMSPEDFEEEYKFKKPAKDTLLSTHCILGIRARTAQLALVGAGYTKVRRYGGSFADWNEKGGPLNFPES